MAGRKPKAPGTSRHHYTKSELADLISRNAKEDDFKNIEAPSYLDRSQKAKFYDLAFVLVHFGLTQLDEDVLARYIIARSFYIYYTEKLQSLEPIEPAKKWAAIQNIDDDDLQELLIKIVEKFRLDDEVTLTKQQNIYHKQMKDCASDLGLSITARGKLILPKREDECEL